MRRRSEPGIFGPYRLLERLADGGTAQIWRARKDVGGVAHDECVLKTLQPRLVGQRLFAELFAAEFRVTRVLSHRGIVRVHEAGLIDGVPFIAMERIDGRDLATIHRALPSGGRIATDVALTIGLEMCRALGHAHLWRDGRGRAHPIVHGDLSPSNVMVRRDGGVTLIDFGAAHMRRRGANVVVGKSGYYAPELLEGAVADARSDVFSAGVVLYELLVGRQLFVVESERETLRRLTEMSVPPPSRQNPRVSAALDEIVLRALDRDSSRRFASANDLADALEWLASTELASRGRVAALLQPEAQRRAARAPALPKLGAAWTEQTGTVSRRRQPGVPPPKPSVERPTRPHRGRALRVLLAAAALAAALVYPVRKPAAPRWLAQSVSKALDALVDATSVDDVKSDEN